MEQSELQNQQKWQGCVKAKIEGLSADEAWSLLKDFCSLHRWIPAVQICHKLAGTDGEPGCIRYCAGTLNRADTAASVGWSKERLVAVDNSARSYTYEVIETNKGFGRYVATMHVLTEVDNGDGSEDDGCVLKWSFEADAVKGWTKDAFVSYLEKLARDVARSLSAEVGRSILD